MEAADFEAQIETKHLKPIETLTTEIPTGTNSRDTSYLACLMTAAAPTEQP